MNTAIVEKLGHNAVFANAITYRRQRTRESTESIIDEVISDIPHIRDFLGSVSFIAMSAWSLDFPNVVSQTPILLLSGIGVFAAVPNIKTIFQERTEQLQELKATLSLQQEYADSQDPNSIEQNQRLELEGIPDTGVYSLDEKQVEEAQRSVDLNMIQRVGYRLQHSDRKDLEASAKSVGHFISKTVGDALFNFVRPKTRKAITKAAHIGFVNTLKHRFIEKGEISKLEDLRTISEEIEDAQSRSVDSLTVKGREVELRMIDSDIIEKLDGIREATRAKAQQLNTATKGFALQGAFISASLGLTALHLYHKDYVEALTQYASANLASNPLRFVGEQTEELYDAIHSQRVAESEVTARLVEETASLV